MRGLRELRDNGFLQLRAPDGTPRGRTMLKAEFLQSFRLAVEDLQGIFSDTMPVEYTPAVIKGETHTEATRRIRRTFIAINSYAKKTDKGENILLDETDGYAIVARRLSVGHALFKDDGQDQRVDWKGTSVTSGSTYLTTLSTLKEATQLFLRPTKPSIFEQWTAPLRGMVPMRPADDELDLGTELRFGLYDHIAALPIFQLLHRTAAHEYRAVLNRWRDFPEHEIFNPLGDRDIGQNRSHLLLRPLGQLILVRAVAELTASESNGGRGLNLQTLFTRLAQLDRNRGFEAHRPQSVWYGVTFSGGRMVIRNKFWAHRLLVHLLAGTPADNERSFLWKNWVGCRISDSRQPTWKDQRGEISPFDWEKDQLPIPLAD
jgi:hypothetical protein